MVDRSNPHRRWPRVRPGIIRYSFTERGRMESWISLVPRAGREIWWYDRHGESNSCHSYCSTMVSPLCYSCIKFKLYKPFVLFENLPLGIVMCFREVTTITFGRHYILKHFKGILSLFTVVGHVLMFKRNLKYEPYLFKKMCPEKSRKFDILEKRVLILL